MVVSRWCNDSGAKQSDEFGNGAELFSCSYAEDHYLGEPISCCIDAEIQIRLRKIRNGRPAPQISAQFGISVKILRYPASEVTRLLDNREFECPLCWTTWTCDSARYVDDSFWEQSRLGYGQTASRLWSSPDTGSGDEKPRTQVRIRNLLGRCSISNSDAAARCYLAWHSLTTKDRNDPRSGLASTNRTANLSTLFLGCIEAHYCK